MYIKFRAVESLLQKTEQSNSASFKRYLPSDLQSEDVYIIHGAQSHNSLLDLVQYFCEWVYDGASGGMCYVVARL